MSIGAGSQCLTYLKEELSKVDDTWAVTRFDSLPHVVHILTSRDRDGEAQLLKEQSDVIEEVVDVVVHAYHGGFNKAIQNYSQILRLFSESAERLAVLKGDLVEAKKLIGARNKQLHQLWYRSMTLRHIISLLDQIEVTAKVPSRIEKLIIQKQLYAAVQLHVQSTLTLEREGLQTVGALQDVRSELMKLRGVLFYKVLEDLHDHLYSKGEYSLYEGNEKDIWKLSETGALSKFTDITITGIPVWLSFSNPDEFIERVEKSDTPLHVKYLHTMVECLCMLGKVSAAGAIICQRMRSTIHDIITSKVKSQAVTMYTFEDDNFKTSQVSPTNNHFLKGKVESYHLSKQMSMNNGIAGTLSAVSPVSSVMAPFGKAQVAARELLHSILETLVGIFENHVVVGKILESKLSQVISMNTPKSAVPDSNISAEYEASQSTGGYNIGFSLSVIQSECQQLICEILRATPEAASADAAIQTARLASKISSKGKRDGSEDALTFAFRFTDAAISVPNNDSDVGHQGWNRRGPNISKEGYGSSVVLPEQGIYLAASLYHPVLQFTNKVSSLLSKEYSQISKDGLQSFVESFVKDNFLPTMFVDYRKAVQQAISNPAAFRPRSHAVGTYTLSVGKGRPILQGLLAVDFLCKEILGWTKSIPRFSDDLLTYVQTLLERAYERCRTAYMEVVLEKLSYMLIGRHDVDSFMKKDPSSAYLPNVFGLNATQNLSDVAIETGFNNFLLNLQSVKQDNLIRDDGKLIMLASLSDSLEYLADTIDRLGQSSSTTSTQFDSTGNETAATHNRTSSMPPKDLGSFAKEYRKLAVDCLKVLRVEMQLVTVFHLQEMSSREYLEDEDTEEPDDFIISLISQITGRDEEFSPFVSESKRNYIFGGVSTVAASAFIKALADMKSINLFGIQQICRDSIALEQVIVAIPSIDKEHVQKILDHVRTYYELLNMPFEALLAFIAEHVDMFTTAEYSCLLKVHVPGRDVPADSEQQLSEILSL